MLWNNLSTGGQLRPAKRSRSKPWESSIKSATGDARPVLRWPCDNTERAENRFLTGASGFLVVESRVPTAASCLTQCDEVDHSESSRGPTDLPRRRWRIGGNHLMAIPMLVVWPNVGGLALDLLAGYFNWDEISNVRSGLGRVNPH